MCGIFGYYRKDKLPLTVEIIESMGREIEHRGPDDQGVYRSEGVALGNQRLSIIDIAHGHQPFYSDDGCIIVVQNGEIFNHVELAMSLRGTEFACRSNSDTEVLLRLYEKEGINFVNKLNGMFAIAIYDARRQELLLVRDRLGVKPLYIHDDGTQLTFSSEIKSLLKGVSVFPKINTQALHHYLTFNYVPPPQTMYQGVQHVMPGCLVRVNSRGVCSEQWWNLAEIQPIFNRSEEEWVEEFKYLLDDSVRIRLRSDVPFGAFLSGGVDSSTVVGLMSKHSTEPIKTYCIGFDDPKYDESAFANEAAERFSTIHKMNKAGPHMLDLWDKVIYHCDQPHGDLSFIPTYLVSRLAAQDVKVVLTGDGADELFGGYDKYVDFFYSKGLGECSNEEFQRRYFDSISLFNQKQKEKLYNGSSLSELSEVNSFDLAKQRFNEFAHQDRINQALYLDTTLLLPGNNLVKPDRMGMAASLEARTPFLDYRMVELAFKMPGDLKLKNGTSKFLYKKAVAPLIGNSLAQRKKQMFTVPVGDWFRGEKKELLMSNLMGKNSKISQVFDGSFLRNMVDRHLDMSENNTRELRALIALEKWLNMTGFDL